MSAPKAKKPPPSSHIGNTWASMFSYRKSCNNVSETTVSQMLRVIFPDYRLKIIRHFHEAAKQNTTKTIGFLIGAPTILPVKNIVEGTEKLDDLTTELLSGTVDHLFDAKRDEELHQLVAAMVEVEDKMLEGSVSPLHMAAVCDLPLAVHFLILQGASTEITDMEGATALLIASTQNRPRVVEALCQEGANVEFRKRGGNTVLFSATAAGNKDVVDILLKYEADPNIPHKSGSTPLWIACANGHLECAASLIRAGAYKNDAVNMRTVVEVDDGCGEAMKGVIASLEERGKIKKPEGEWNEEDGNNLMGLMAAAQSKPSGEKAGGGSTTVVAKGGATPMWIAACNGHADVCDLLIEKGANPELHCDGTTPLWIAAANGHHEVVATLRWRVKLEPRAIDGATPLWVSAENGYDRCVQSLLDGGAEPDARSIDQRTPLHISAANRHLQTVLMLVKRGANAQAQAVDGSTPAHLLMSAGYTTAGRGDSEWEEVMNALLEAGVQLSATKSDGANALHEAVKARGAEQVAYLLKAGSIDPNQRSTDGCGPLHVAAIQGDIEIMKMLLAVDEVEIDLPCSSAAEHPGATPLWLAADNNRSEAVELLLEHGAEVIACTAEEVTPLMAAITRGHTACISPLQMATRKVLSKKKETNLGGKISKYPTFVLRC